MFMREREREREREKQRGLISRGGTGGGAIDRLAWKGGGGGGPKICRGGSGGSGDRGGGVAMGGVWMPENSCKFESAC